MCLFLCVYWVLLKRAKLWWTFKKMCWKTKAWNDGNCITKNSKHEQSTVQALLHSHKDVVNTLKPWPVKNTWSEMSLASLTLSIFAFLLKCLFFLCRTLQPDDHVFIFQVSDLLISVHFWESVENKIVQGCAKHNGIHVLMNPYTWRSIENKLELRWETTPNTFSH